MKKLSIIDNPNEKLVLRIGSHKDQISETNKSVDINPTFLLKGIDPSSILKTYIQGGYDNKKIPGEKIDAVEDVITADQIVGENPESEIYEYVDRTNTRRRIVTTNHRKYAMVRDGIQIDDSSKNGKICRWCRRIFFHNEIGIPLRMEYLSDKKITIYHIDGTFCTGECVLELIKLKTHCPITLREALYKDSETMLRIMFDAIYPGEILGNCFDWWLLECNGGPISEKDFFSKLHVYSKTPNVILLPSKTEYTVDLVPRQKSKDCRGSISSSKNHH